MVNGDAVKEIAKLKEEGMIFDIGGSKYSPIILKKVLYEPKPEPVKVGTLSGLADFLSENKDKLKKEELLIQVKDHANVLLFGKIEGEDLHRKYYLHVVLDDCFKSFPFGEYLELENFIIRLRSLFVHNENCDNLISFASSVTMSDEGVRNDNGISQTVVVKKGISGALTESAKAPASVKLTPYRTFREIDQVESEFLFRLKTASGGIPACALFEADGGIWRIKAISAIRDWLKEKIEDVSIIS